MSTSTVPSEMENTTTRILMATLGGLAGLTGWVLVDVLPDTDLNGHLQMALTALMFGFFAVLLALTGPVRLRSAVLSALAVAVPVAVLMSWASLRYDDVGDFLDHGWPVAALIGVVFIATPFVAAALERARGWRDYELLFDTAWTITVRYAAAWLFTAVFWGVLMLSNALLELVGIKIIEDLLEIDGVPYVLSGIVLGLALAVVHELRDYVSPFLILRLLRLLLPVVLVVVAVFIGALPMRGLSGLFGNLSTAGTLFAMAVGAITLVTTAIDRTDTRAVSNRPMRVATQILAVLTPVLAMLGLWAVWLRVGQYGWTPDRIVAMLVAVILSIYAVFYALAVVMRRDWMGRIRQTNIFMALALIGVVALWMTPLLNAERISTNSQIARLQDGKVTVATMPLWDLAHEWGHAGQAGLTQLQQMTELADHQTLLTRIEKVRDSNSRYAYERKAKEQTATQELQQLVAYPADVPFSPDAITGLSGYQTQRIATGCARTLADGGPGCVLVWVPFDPENPAQQGVILYNEGGDRVRGRAVHMDQGKLVFSGNIGPTMGRSATQLRDQAILDIRAGAYQVVPVSRNGLRVGGQTLIPNN